jgi:rod shape-determining protein MreC
VLLLVFVVLSIIVITLDFRQRPDGPLAKAKDIAVTIVAPIQRGFTAVTRPVGDFFSSVGNIANLKEQNDRLKRELQATQTDARSVPTLEAENIELRRVLDLAKSWRGMDTVAAEVIGKSPSNWNWAVEIGKGSADGIKRNMAVIDPDGLVGKVIQTTRHTSTVLLLIDPEAAAAARLEDEGDIATVRGNGGNEPLSLEFLPTDAAVEVGDQVVTAGFDGGVFPAGIPVGTVDEVGGEDAAVERSVTIEPSVNFESLQYVTVLLETGDRLRTAEAEGR